MSISSLPQLLAGMQPTQYFTKAGSATLTNGRPTSFWSVAGSPAQGSFSSALAGATYTNQGNAGAGQIIRNEPAGGNTAYMARFMAFSGQPAIIWLCDRIWDNGGITITSTSPQTINSPTWPSRDANGATAGVGIALAVEVGAATGAGTPTISVSYTNTVGLAGQTATNFDPTASTAQVGDFFRLKLASGDQGVQSVQSITLGSSWTSGTIHLVAYRLIYALNQVTGKATVAVDPVTCGLPVIYTGTMLFIAAIPQSTTAFGIQGIYAEAQG